MTDRELLEAAARVAGYGYSEWTKGGIVFALHDATWNPLTDDGDALRLAIAIASKPPGATFEINISKMHDGRGFCSSGFRSRDIDHEAAIEADLGAATRRAIVRAAAQIGKAMP